MHAQAAHIADWAAGRGQEHLIQRVLQELQLPPHAATGFWTEEVRDSSTGERTGFDVVTMDGRRSVLSRVGTARRGAHAVGKYVVDVPSFEALALSAIQPRQQAAAGGTGQQQQQQPSAGGTRQQQLVVIDEIGKMELLSASFYPAVLAVLDSPHLLALGTVPVARYGRTIPQVEALKARPDVKVITVTKDTRERLMQDV